VGRSRGRFTADLSGSQSSNPEQSCVSKAIDCDRIVRRMQCPFIQVARSRRICTTVTAMRGCRKDDHGPAARKNLAQSSRWYRSLGPLRRPHRGRSATLLHSAQRPEARVSGSSRDSDPSKRALFELTTARRPLRRKANHQREHQESHAIKEPNPTRFSKNSASLANQYSSHQTPESAWMNKAPANSTRSLV